MAGIAKYHTVLKRLEAMIQSGLFHDGKLPSEPELAKRFEVSRSVVRQAYRELEKRGIIERKPGSGTRLRGRLAKKNYIVSMTDQIKDAGMEPSTEVVAFKRIMADQANGWIAQAFGIAPEAAPTTALYYIDRLRCGDGIPLTKQTIYLLAEQFREDVLQATDFEKSIFALYAKHDRFAARAEETIEARWATPEEVEYLEMSRLPDEEKLIYVRDRITWDFQDQVLEVLHSIDRWDFFRRYRYSIQGASRTEAK